MKLPGFGSQLVGVTREGARIFLEEMNRQKAAHFDAFIFQLGEGRMHENSCFVYPPVGNFDAHESGTTPGIRESMFDKKWFIGQPVIPGSGGVVAWLWIEFGLIFLLVCLGELSATLCGIFAE